VWIKVWLNVALPQQELQPLIMYQEDGAPLHWNLDVQEFLNLTISGQTNSTSSMITWHYSFAVTWGLKWPITWMRHRHPICSNYTLTQNATTDTLAHTRAEFQYWIDVLLAIQGDTQRIVPISNSIYEGTKCGQWCLKLFHWY
jgi:hypothetical protein